MAKQIVNGIFVYSRHSAKCPQAKDPGYVKCRCRKWLQYQKDGKTIQKSAKTRFMEQAKLAAEKLSRGEPDAGSAGKGTLAGKTIESAVSKWLEVRTAEGIRANTKAKFIGATLVKWAREQKPSITYLHEITTPVGTEFFIAMSKHYAKETSGSFKIHWAMIRSFFKFAVEQGMLKENPLPKRKIKFEKPEVVPPSRAEVERVLEAAEGTTKLFLKVARHTGMAIQDCVTLDRVRLVGTLVRGNRVKTKKTSKRGCYRVRIPQDVADAVLALPGERYFFWDEKAMKLSNAVHLWRKNSMKVFKAAGVDMTPHDWRHFFITEKLSKGMRLELVSKLVGTSADEIKETYEHWIQDTEDLLDEAQSQDFLAQGLDEQGNEVKPTVQ